MLRSLLILAAAAPPCEPHTPSLERMISMGEVIQNLLLVAHAMGFGAGLTSGQAMSPPRLCELCDLSEGEMPVCCVNIDSVAKRKPASRQRPTVASILSALGSDSATSGV